jgi:hypothetical protein
MYFYITIKSLKMKNKSIVNQLKNFPKDSEVSLKLKLTKYSLTEICYHSGIWDGKNFFCESQSNWKHSEAESSEVNLEELIELLSSKTIDEMSSDNFSNLSLGDSTDGNIEVSEIEWEGDINEEEQSDVDPMDLYWNSDINDSDITFAPSSIWFMEIDVNGEKFSIEN